MRTHTFDDLRAHLDDMAARNEIRTVEYDRDTGIATVHVDACGLQGDAIREFTDASPFDARLRTATALGREYEVTAPAGGVAR